MGPETPLRIASKADVAPITDLVVGFRNFMGSDSPDKATIEAVAFDLIADRNTEFILIGEPPCGFAQVRYRLSVWTGSDDAWVEDVFVEDDQRGNGYGRILVEAAIQSATRRGCRRIQLDVNQDNKTALTLYESLGFVTIHNEEKWEAADLMMTRYLTPH